MSTSIPYPKKSCCGLFFSSIFLAPQSLVANCYGSCSPLRFASLRHTDMSERPRQPGCVKRIVRHAGFDFFFAFVVLTNSIFIGVEVQLGLENQGARPLAIYIFQYAYTFLFSLELAMRLWADCRYFLCSEEWMCLGQARPVAPVVGGKYSSYMGICLNIWCASPFFTHTQK